MASSTHIDIAASSEHEDILKSVFDKIAACGEASQRLLGDDDDEANAHDSDEHDGEQQQGDDFEDEGLLDVGEDLNLGYMGITNEMVPHILERLRNQRVRPGYLSFESNEIKAAGAIEIFNYVAESRTLSGLEIGRCELGDAAMQAAANMLRRNQHLSTLNLNDSAITDTGFAILAEALRNNETLSELIISSNKGITEVSLPHIYGLATKENPILITFDETSIPLFRRIELTTRTIVHNAQHEEFAIVEIERMNLKDDGVKILFENLGSVKERINEINLSSNNITSIGLAYLCEYIKNASGLTMLNLSYNPLNDEGATVLGKALRDLPTNNIDSITLYRCGFTDLGVLELLPGLLKCKYLTYLSLSDNPKITDESITWLMQIIPHCTLYSIDLDGTSTSHFRRFELNINIHLCKVLQRRETKAVFEDMEFVEDYVKLFCDTLDKCGSDLMGLVFNSCTISSGALQKILDYLKTNSFIASLEISSTDFEDVDIDNVCNFIVDKPELKILTLEAVGLDDDAITKLSRVIIGNMTLQTLNLQSNSDITAASMEYLEEMASGSYLKKMILNDTQLKSSQKNLINRKLKVPVDDRAIPVASSSKSAAKSQY